MPSEEVKRLTAQVKAGNDRLAEQVRYLRLVGPWAMALMVAALVVHFVVSTSWSFAVLCCVILLCFVGCAPGLYTPVEVRESAKAMRRMSELPEQDWR